MATTTTPTSATPPTLPIIDISPFLPAPSVLSKPVTATLTPAQRATAAALADACRSTGFFYLTRHGIPASTLSHVLDLARRFFCESSDADKDAIARRDPGDGGDGARGYQRIGENVTKGRRDRHEAVDLYRAWRAAAAASPSGGAADDSNGDGGLLQGPNLWPAHPSELRAAYEAYIERVKEVGTAVVRAMGVALALDGGAEEVFVEATRDSFWVMRLIGYPGLPQGVGGDEGISCGEHTDYGCVTLLLTDDTPGALQVQLKDWSWIAADPLPGSHDDPPAFVVNIGDMMERWTNGLWKSTNHRVIHKGSNYRVSVPFFFEPDFDARIKPLAKCLRETGGVERYDEVEYGEHLMGKVRGNFY